MVSVILDRRSLVLSESTRAYQASEERRVEGPKHLLLHRLKRLRRLLNSERVDDLAVQVVPIPHTVGHLGRPRWLGLRIDWTMLNTVTPSGRRVRYKVLRIAVPRRRRALPLLQVAYDRDDLAASKSQHRLEEEALLAVGDALPKGVHPVILGDCGFARPNFFVFQKIHGLDYVIRIDKATCMTEIDGHRWKLGEEGTRREEIRRISNVRYAVYHALPETRSPQSLACRRLPERSCRPRLALALLDHLHNLLPTYLPSSSLRSGYACERHGDSTVTKWG